MRVTKTQDQNHNFRALVKADALRWNESLNTFNFMGMLLLQSGFQLAFLIRAQQAISGMPVFGRLMRKIIGHLTCIVTSCHCSAKASYGAGLYFPHPSGIVIGDGVEIENNVTIYQGVTLGLKELGTDKYPTVEDSAVLYAGSKIMGDVHIGKNATVGANAVVMKDVPQGASAVGIPARIIKKSV